MSAGLVSLGDDQVDARVHVALGVLCLAGECADHDACFVTTAGHDRGRWAEGVHHEGGFERKSDF